MALKGSRKLSNQLPSLLRRLCQRQKQSTTQAARFSNITKDKLHIQTVENPKEDARIYQDPYQPLNKDKKEIRLLLVKAGCGSQPVRCEILQAFLSSDPKPEYETISYCWGDPDDKSEIFLNSSLVRVPTSSKAAVQCMRLPDKDRVLWIDAICINQGDAEERGHQVGLMHEVYLSTWQNLIWLGCEDSYTAEALYVMDLLLQNAREVTNGFETFKEILEDTGDGNLQIPRDSKLDLDFTPLLQLFEKPWFRRLWVVQEATLSPSNICFCGSYTFALEDILRVAMWMLINRRSLRFTLHRKDAIYDLRRLFRVVDRQFGSYNPFGQKSLRTHAFIASLRAFGTTDRKDHVFGLLGLYMASTRSRKLPDLLTPDYTKSTGEIFRNATILIIREDRNFSFLASLAHDPSVSIKSPSWVPDWALADYDRTQPPQFAHGFSSDDDTEVQESCFECVDDPNTLSAVGFAVGIVTGVASVANRTSRASDVVETVREIASLVSEIGVTEEAMGRTLIGDTNSDGMPASEHDCLNFLEWRKHVELRKSLPPKVWRLAESMEEPESDLYRAALYQYGLHGTLLGRRFFVTNQKHIGIGPQVMEVGDVVAVIYGSRLPVILRPAGEFYLMIGQCYTDGIMYGEAVQKHRAEGGEDIWFHIR